tara:strand:+ start:677 stop:1093 length:417 start_codon:yes stop_codon:yes gene_type:complete
MDDQRLIELIKKYLDFEITHDFNDWDNTDFKVYTETTTDGYEVFIATFDDRNISICEDVYYYNNDLSSAVKQEITNGMVFYIEEYLYEDMYFDDELVELFVENVDDIYAERFELGITEEEEKYLKEEYGIEEEEAEVA